MNVWMRNFMVGFLLLLIVNGLCCMYKPNQERVHTLQEYIFLKQRDFYGCLPIYYAAVENNFELIKKMVERGSPVNETSLFGPSLLSFAREYNNSELYQFLIAHGATDRGMPLPELSDISGDDM